MISRHKHGRLALSRLWIKFNLCNLLVFWFIRGRVRVVVKIGCLTIYIPRWGIAPEAGGKLRSSAHPCQVKNLT